MKMKKREENIEIVKEDSKIKIGYDSTLKSCKEGVRVEKAVMKLKGESINESGNPFQVTYKDEVIDEFVSLGSNGCLAIEITEQLIESLDNNLEQLELKIIEPENGELTVSEKEVLLEYKSKKEEISNKGKYQNRLVSLFHI